MITERDIRMIRRRINCNLREACKAIRAEDFRWARRHIDFARGMAEACAHCNGGPGLFGSIGRVEGVLQKSLASVGYDVATAINRQFCEMAY